MYRFLEYRVGQYMTHPVQTVTPDVPLRELESLFEKHDFNAFPVVNTAASREMIGLVTKFDFLKVFAFSTGQLLPHYDELMNQTVQDVMVEAVVSVTPDTPLTRALQHMVNLRARSLPVVAPNGLLLGVIAREDIMRALQDATQTD
jgi:CBS-domain-containing membrane protein